jgi:hypothetical protein
MGRTRSGSLSFKVAVTALIATIAAGGTQGEDRVFAVHISHQATARMVRNALEGAAQRLERPRCQELLDRFADAEGRPLRASLEKTGVSGAAYLSLLVFYDGSRQPRCGREGTFAAAEPGSRIVWICPESFRRLAWSHQGTAEVIVIHEALHSLGLGENPPSSSEITARVTSACLR